jgi:hypothetical protein
VTVPADRFRPAAGRRLGPRSGATRLLTVAVLLLSAAPARPSPSDGLPTEFRPSFPVFGGGDFVNFTSGDNQAVTNAAAHVGFSLAIPLLGEHIWGRKGLWISGLSWMAFTLVHESMFHAPPNAGPGYAAEVRSDLITRLVPCATLLVIDALSHGSRASMNPERSPGAPAPPERPGRPWPIGLELPRPTGQSEAGRLSAPSFANVGEPLVLRSMFTRDPVAQPTVAPAPAASAVTTTRWSDPSQRDSGATMLCTASLLFQGSPACAWVTGRPGGTRRVAAR